MTDIKERAKAYAEERVNQMFCIPEEMPTEKQKANMMKGHEMAYIKIATEQKKIDDENLEEVKIAYDEIIERLKALNADAVKAIQRIRNDTREEIIDKVCWYIDNTLECGADFNLWWKQNGGKEIFKKDMEIK